MDRDEELAIAEAVGKRVKAAREAAGLSQAALADLIPMRVPHLSRLENGRRVPSIPLLARIAAALGVPGGDLWPGPPAPKRKAKPQ